MRPAVTCTLRAVRLVIRDGRIPRPLRWAGALGLLPVPGPFDEIVPTGRGVVAAGPAQAVVWNRVRAASVRYAFSARGLLPRLKVEE